MAHLECLPPYVLGLVTGIVSGAAMLPYTVIKEANPPQFGGTATGVVNFLNFTFSALLGPVFGWILQSVSADAPRMELQHFQTTFTPLLVRSGARNSTNAVFEGNGTGSSGEIKMDSSNWNRKIRTTARALRGPGADSNSSGASVRSDGFRRRRRSRQTRV